MEPSNKQLVPQEQKIVLIFKKVYPTKKKIRYDEQLGEQTYSERDFAIGYIYPFTEAMELIGSPDMIRVTIEACSGDLSP
jgi:hypothetical protein